QSLFGVGAFSNSQSEIRNPKFLIMCGICGAVDFSGAVNAAEVVRVMTPTMRHRGPDGEGISDFGFRSSDFAGSLAIGMRRLSIIDIEGGHQPVFNDDGSVGVMLNGEIYNF